MSRSAVLQNIDFRCGCGRDYSRYPALYTHIKLKHDGKPPPGTIRKSTRKEGSRRGRPRKDQSRQFVTSNEGSERKSTLLTEIMIFIGEKGRFAVKDVTYSLKNQYIRDYDQPKIVYKDSFPSQDLIPREFLIDGLLKRLKDAIIIAEKKRGTAVSRVEDEERKFRKKEVLSDRDEDIKTGGSIIDATAAFIVEIGVFLTQTSFAEVCLFFYALLFTFESCGREITHGDEGIPRGQEMENFICDVESCEKLQDYADEFIEIVYTFHQTAQPHNGLSFLGEQRFFKENAVKFTGLFSIWLYCNEKCTVMLMPAMGLPSSA